MKTAFTLSVAALGAALLLGACQKNLQEQDNAEIHVYRCVFAEENDTRVSISDAGKTKWVAGDEIMIHGGTDGKKRLKVTLAASDISADGKTATIRFSGLDPYVSQYDYVVSTYYAQYPACAVPEGNMYYECCFNDTNHPLMAACDVGDTFVFYNVTGIISYKVSGDFDKVVFSGNKGETVAYDYYQVRVRNDNTGITTNFHKPGNGFKEYTPYSTLEASVVADGSTVNYICLPNGADFTSGFTMKFKKGETVVKVAETSTPVNVARAKILPLGNINSHLREPSAGENHHSSIPTGNAVDLGADGTANCYIAGNSGTYKFKAVKGNGSSSVGNIGSAEVLWETWCTTDAPTKGSVVSAVDFEDGYIYLQTGTHAGNAVIAAKNSSGAILWSWHIWVPETTIETGTYKLSAGLLMDRNLGALAVSPSGTDARCFGLFYQWGRKDPFPANKSLSGNGPMSVAGTAITFVNETTTLEGSIAAPTSFYMVDNSDWNSTPNDDLWGYVSGKKSIYDPCPPGYKVPTNTEAGGLFSDLTVLEGWANNVSSGYFQAGSPVTTFPFAGYIDDYFSSQYAKAGIRALIWSAYGSGSSTPGVKGHGLDVRSDSSPISCKFASPAKARGGAVRCVSEEIAPFENEPNMPVMGSYTKTDFTAAQMGELSGLCFSKDKDFMWGVGDSGVLYEIGFDMTVSTHFTVDTDMEGITLDPATNNLILCTEPKTIKKIPFPNYNSISTLFYVTEAADMGNSGLEGITYYKDNVIYTGSQSGATLWAYSLSGNTTTSSTPIWKKSLGAIAPGIEEVGDLYYDPETDLLWVSDSEAFKLFVFDGAVTTLKAIYDIKFVGNPEAVLVDHTRNCVWIGDDRGDASRIYKVSFTNLSGTGK